MKKNWVFKTNWIYCAIWNVRMSVCWFALNLFLFFNSSMNNEISHAIWRRWWWWLPNELVEVSSKSDRDQERYNAMHRDNYKLKKNDELIFCWAFWNRNCFLRWFCFAKYSHMKHWTERKQQIFFFFDT